MKKKSGGWSESLVKHPGFGDLDHLTDVEQHWKESKAVKEGGGAPAHGKGKGKASNASDRRKRNKGRS